MIRTYPMHIFNPVIKSLAIALAFLMLSLVAIQPFLHGRMLLTDDGTLHLYRTIVLDHSLRFDDALYPRYSSALAYGYGAPLFNYFSPAAYLLPRTLHTLGMTFTHAWLAGMVVYLWLAMGGAYLLGKIWVGSIGGIACAVSYLYAPYMLYDAVSRGTITEVAALAMLPIVLWALTLLARHPRWWTFALATLTYIVFIPLHNIVTLHGSLLIGAYSLLLITQSSTKRTVLLHLLGVAIFGLLLTCFFWLPALGETQYVKINQVTDSLPSLDVTQNLRPLSEIAALPVAVDPQRQQATIPITVSWIGLAAGFIAIVLSFINERRLLGVIVFWWCVVLLMLFMNTESSAWLWENVPMLKYTQFAWRTLGVASLGLAMLSGIGLGLLVVGTISRTYQNAILGIFLVISISYSFSFTYRPFLRLNADSVQDAQQYERERSEVALSSYSEYLPITNTVALDAHKLVDRWRQSNIISRLDEVDGLNIISQSWSGTSGEFVYQSEVAQTLVLNWLWMPGFVSTINGNFVEVTSRENDGLVQLPVPSGNHEVKVWFRGTSLQQSAVLVSLFGFLGFGFVVAGWRVRKVNSSYVPSYERLPMATLWVVATVSIICFAVKSLWIDQTSNIFHQAHWADTTSDQQPFQSTNFNNQLLLLVNTSPQMSTNSPFILSFSTSWTLHNQPIQQKLAAKYILRNSQGVVITESDGYQIGGLDTTRWLSGLYLKDNVVLDIPDFTPPGKYDLYISVFDTLSLLPVPTINSSGNIDIPEVKLAHIVFDDMNYPLQVINTTPNPLTIQKVNDLTTMATTGDAITLDFLWGVSRSLQVEYNVRIIWQQNGKKTLTSQYPLCGDHATTSWIQGEQWRCFIQTYVPAILGSKDYELALLVESNESAFTLPLGTVKISNPDRLFIQPSIDQVSDLLWSSGIELIGYTKKDNTLELVWKTRKLIDKSLHLFVHLLDENGIIVAQSNGIPVDWTRPTTSWVMVEYIVAVFQFEELRNEKIQIEVGFYDPTSYERILLDGGTDSAKIFP